ncbi:hypothetical protein CK934_28095 [Chitinophaga sp. MD30]|nr:hypothetical protein CK934_28095 [Chitinophaga sp. MD30]
MIRPNDMHVALCASINNFATFFVYVGTFAPGVESIRKRAVYESNTRNSSPVIKGDTMIYLFLFGLRDDMYTRFV